MFFDAAKIFGPKVKSLNEYEDENDEAKGNPIKDLEIYEHVIKHTYGEIRSTHRGVVDNLRTTERETFVRVQTANRGGRRAQDETQAYSKIDEEVQKIKQKAQQARNFLANDFV